MNESSSRHRWTQRWGLGALLILVTLFAYQPAWNGEPVFDDDDHLTPPELQSVSGLARIWTEVGVVSQYYPITHSFFWLQHRLWGDAMLGYHLLTILLHAGSALLLMRIMKRLALPGAWLAAGIFALHPVHVESVAWISELKNTLSTLAYLGAALVYLRYDHERSRRLYFAALALFGFALLSKTVTASLPAALLVVFWWRRGRLSWVGDVRPLVPFFAAGVVAGLFTAWVERRFIGAEGAAFDLTFVERGLIAGRAILFYLGKLVWPADLIFIYPRWSVSQAALGQYAFPLLAIGLVAAAWWLRRRSRGPLAALLLFAGTLFPVLGFLNVYPFIYSFVADHYVYLASLGLVAAAAAGIATVLTRAGLWGRPAGHAVCVGLLAALAVLTWRQSRMYTDVETLWSATLAKNPACFVAHSNLGQHHLQRGRVDEAIAHAEKALALRPGFAEIHNNLGGALLEKGRVDEALVHFLKAVELRPGLAVAHHNLGAIAFRRGRVDEAMERFRRAVELRPDFVKARANLGGLLLEKGRTEEALVHIEKALELRPDDPDARTNLGNALLRAGRSDEAIAQYRRALAAQPDDANALTNLGHALLQQGRLDDAIPLLRRAVTLKPDLALAHSGLGNGLLHRKAVDDAIHHFEQALRLRPDDATAHNDLGSALLQKGRLDEALARYGKALALRPDYDLAHFNLGYALLEAGRVDEAIARLEKAVAIQPEFVQSRYRLGNALLQSGRPGDAIAQLEKAVALQPTFVDALNNLGVALVQTGREAEAMLRFRKAVTVQPDFAEGHNNLGRLLLQRGEAREAVTHYRASLKIEPENPDTLANLAWVLATWPDATVRNGVQAIVLAQRANQHSGGREPLVLRALAAAYAEAGRFGEAAPIAKEALRLAGLGGVQANESLVEELRAQLERYEAGSPFRETVRERTPAEP